MDSRSLDHCIQAALASLFPPFQATSPTVLCQVLSAVESYYRGDGFRYLIHFLLPAKHFLQRLQQDACAQFGGLLFRHEGWPLCLHEKIVVQLSPLDRHLQRPEDFYLLLVPPAALPSPPTHAASSCPRLLACSVSDGGHHVERQEVSALGLRSVFSMAWLDSVNMDRAQRGMSRLERCLLSAQGDVFRVPWEDVVHPQFIHRPRTAPTQAGEELSNQSHDLPGHGAKPQTDQSAVFSEGEESEGEYVELTELALPRFSPQKGSLTQSISLQHRARRSTRTHMADTHTHATGDHTHAADTNTHVTTSHPTNTHTAHTQTATSSCQSQHPTPGSHPYTPSGQGVEGREVGGIKAAALVDVGEEEREESFVAAEEEEKEVPEREEEQESGEVDKEGAVVVKIEEEVEPVVVRQNQASRHDGEGNQEVRGGEEQEEAQRASGPMFSTEEAPLRSDKHDEHEIGQPVRADDSYSEEITEPVHLLDSYSGEITEPVHLLDSYSGEITEPVHLLDSYSERITEPMHLLDSYSGEITEPVHLLDSYSERITEPVHLVNSYSEETTEPVHLLDSYSERITEPVHLVDSYSEETTEPVHLLDSYSERITEPVHLVDSYSEETTKQIYTETSCSEKLPEPTHTENSYSERLIEHSFCEKPTKQKLMGDSYSEELPAKTHNEDSERCTEHTNAVGSYSENGSSTSTEPKHAEDSYSENPIAIRQPERSCCEDLAEHARRENSCLEDALTLESAVVTMTTGASPPPEEPPQDREEPEKVEGKWHQVDEGLLSADPSPAEPQEPSADQSPGPVAPIQVTQTPESSQSFQPPRLSGSSSRVGFSRSSLSCRSFRSGFSRLLLKSGLVCLPGSRGRSGSRLLTVCAGNTLWSHPECDSMELFRLLRYYTSTLSASVPAWGLIVLVDARKAAPVPALFCALTSLQEDVPGCVHNVLLWTNKDTSLKVDKAAAPQVEVFNSLKCLQKHVDVHQLPAQFGGSFSFCHSSWLDFRSRVEQLTDQCEGVIHLLQKNINIMETTALPAAAEEAEQLLSTNKTMMGSILQDRQLVQLQQEGGASLSLLRRDEGGVGLTEDYVAAVDAVSCLYERVDELLHRLVTLSNARTQELNFIMDFRSLEEGFAKVRSWLEEVGEVRLRVLNQSEDSLDALNRKQLEFKDFYSSAYDHCKQGQELLSRLERWGNISSADLHVYVVKVRSFWAELQDFSQRVNATGRNIEKAARLYRFLDQAYGWAIKGRHRLAGITADKSMLPEQCQAVIGSLEEYQRQHPPIPEARFQEMKALAGELRDERGLRQWSFAWSKCQEARSMFDRKMADVRALKESAHRRRSDSVDNARPVSTETATSEPTSCPPKKDPSPSSAPVSPQQTPLLQRLFGSEASFGRLRLNSSACPAPSFSYSSRRQLLRKTQSFDCPAAPEGSRYCPSPRTLSEPARRGNTGVFIRGLEVSSTEASDRTLCPRTPAPGWGARNPGTPGSLRSSEAQLGGSKLRHIVEEMVTTEREYVRSLRYIIEHYFPEMDRADLPQDLRGKRSVVFGNLEKLLDFHSQFFLKELEACWKHPLRVSQCFLRHKEQFSLYALYSKNKPKSDALLANHGLVFFKRKQLELGDKMDLSSYLLKPIQRMSKYALLLTDLIKEVGVAQEAELHSLQSATGMVKFQLRHGNDLLAMDAICNCDVNLKEQGQLIRQDEFTVWSGRRKSLRRVFLFEELLLLSKAKKMEGGLDVFIYKQSFKTADLGLTESAGDNGLRFEIWFRRRTTKNQTLILQATTAKVKHAWTGDITRILWTQATRNKEVRLKEMVSMGVGNKPFLDIQPSAAAISDRAVHYITKTRGARTRASIAVSVFDHSKPFKRPAVTSDPSSSSLLGSLNLHVFRYEPPGGEQVIASSFSCESSAAGDAAFVTPCIEEDEQEHETASQPSMTTESSGSSSRCLSGSTGSDSGCVSSNLQEALQEEQSSSSCSSHKRIISGSASVIGPATMV
uniref:rho guanine nucleotide exchange factor 40 isoform X2 n=1 Tax=Doryrhamphus excisus TaxID=161450 RepID=UPI0025AE7244|nr:rho guanine nucleotide exchange factor 40 isoform X2 [Doryrhamphus excisus]